MPWRVTCAMDERMRFIVEHERGEHGMAELCRAHGISRKTGYKWLERYRADGIDGLAERSRAPHRRPGQVAAAVAERLLAARAAHPTWGPRKLLAWVGQREPELALPAASTAGDLLRRAGLTVARRPRRRASPTGGGPLAACAEANAVWCADFKGQFHTQDGSLCYPLTISDAASRFFLRCQLLPGVGGGRVPPPVRGGLPRLRAAGRHPHRQRPALRLDRAGRADGPGRLVDRAGHPPRSWPAGPPAGQRPPRAAAPHPQGGDGRPAGRDPARATGRLRCLPPRLQH